MINYDTLADHRRAVYYVFVWFDETTWFIWRYDADEEDPRGRRALLNARAQYKDARNFGAIARLVTADGRDVY